MSQRIEELKDLHIKSKPEVEKFIANVAVALKAGQVPRLRYMLSGTTAVVKGYDSVIDELFEHIEHIERIAKENAELHDSNARLHADMEGHPQQLSFREERIQDLEQRIADLEDALRWYANPDNYGTEHLEKHGYIPIDKDGGQRARAALGESEQP
ncbi:hypothetical protein WMW72_10795 [Paenibacillus filicis]|uniref:Uncharacterized protein n=1 Tax=Paenibacillus filicis TaxID=669464 RepID=A0ABU9DHN5_9BACL